MILTACTEYFSRLEQEEGGEGKEPGQIDMPSHFTPEALAPIIRCASLPDQCPYFPHTGSCILAVWT